MTKERVITMTEENVNHCKRIAKTIDKIAEGNVYLCPECGEMIELDQNTYNEEEGTYICPCCKEEIDENDLETCGFYDYLNDVYDIEYRIGADREYRSARIMVACGGPNIFIDTQNAMVELHWWSEYAEYPFSYEARDQINEVMEEIYASE